MNQLSVLLLVDPDQRGLQTLTYGFEREGCTVAGTSDPKLAPELVRTATPQLAVISLRAAENGGFDLISGLRGEGAGQKLPVITLGPASLKAAALAAGATGFLSTPLFVRDVVNVSRLLAISEGTSLADTGAGDPGKPEVREIHGRLSEYGGVYYLTRAMAAMGRSGILLLSRGNRKAEVRFSEGTVAAAHVAALQGLPALHHLLLWEEAALSLKFRAVARSSQLSLAAHDLLNECERFLRDFTHAARTLGSPRSVYAVVETGTRASGLEPGQIAPVLRLFDGHRALADVIEDSPFRIFDTLRVIKRLVDAGALSAQPEGDRGGGPAATERPPQWQMEQWALAADHLDRARIEDASAGAAPDQRGAIPERRRSSRRIKPVPAAGSAPIPLTVKKSAASGEIQARKRMRTPPVPQPDFRGGGATVEIRADGVRLPTPAPLLMVAPAPVAARHSTPPPARVPTPGPARQTGPYAPLGPPPAAQPAAPPAAPALSAPPAPAARAESKPRLKKVPSHPHVDAGPAFDDVEADFFAREADLYKPVVVESFEDLEDRGQQPQSGRPKPQPTRSRKKR